MRTAQRLARIRPTHQTRVVWRNAHGQRPIVLFDRLPFVGRQAENSFEFGQRANARAHLPTPVVPLNGRRAGIKFSVEAAGFGTNWKTECRFLFWRLSPEALNGACFGEM